MRRFDLLRSPAFTLAVLLLLLNDFCLKSNYPGWFTGKCSDFAGVYAFTLFLLALWPQKAAGISAGVAGAFILWKLPATRPLVEAANWSGLAVGRVEDLSDLLALPMAGVALLQLKFSRSEPSNGAPLPMMICACFAFMATSSAARISPEAQKAYDEFQQKWPWEYERIGYSGSAGRFTLPARKERLLQVLRSEENLEVHEHWPIVPIFLVPFFSNTYSVQTKGGACVPPVSALNSAEPAVPDKTPLRLFVQSAAFELEDYPGGSLLRVNEVWICKRKGADIAPNRALEEFKKNIESLAER